MNRNNNRKRMPSRQRKTKNGFASFFIFLILIGLAIFFLKNKNKIGSNNEIALIGQGKEEEVSEESGKDLEKQGKTWAESETPIIQSFLDRGERPVFDSNNPEDWIKNLEIATTDYPNAQIILDHQDQISKGALKLAGNNFSSIDFVAKTINSEVDFSYNYPVNLNGGEYPYYLQWDEEWAFENYANGFLGLTGCGPTSVAMAVSGILNDDSITPTTVAALSEENGFSFEGGTDWRLFPFIGNHYGVHIENIGVDEETVLNHLNEGHAIIVSVGPGDFTLEGHIMLITGKDFLGRLIINDPNSKEKSEKRWSLDRILEQTKAMWAIYE